MNRKLILLIFIFFVIISSWTIVDFTLKDSVIIDNIQVDHTLYENLSISKRVELQRAIRKTLDKDSQSLRELIHFDCGGAAGCYDLGFVLTQIIYRIGEDTFVGMAQRLDNNDLSMLNGLVVVGLEYGDQNKDGKTDEKNFDQEFPIVYKFCFNTQLKETK